MITIYNASSLARQPFFQKLIHFLQEHEGVTLRQIKAAFEEEPHLDRQLDQYIKAGYVIRENRRYRNGFTLLESLDGLTLHQQVFVATNSAVAKELSQVTFPHQLTNPANHLIIEEEVDFVGEDLTLATYFYKMRTQEALSGKQKALYALLGDVNPDYALKYMTTFLLKFTRKDRVLQRRRDIFVEALVLLGFIREVAPQTYQLTMELDKERLLFCKKRTGVGQQSFISKKCDFVVPPPHS